MVRSSTLMHSPITGPYNKELPKHSMAKQAQQTQQNPPAMMQMLKIPKKVPEKPTAKQSGEWVTCAHSLMPNRQFQDRQSELPRNSRPIRRSTPARSACRPVR